MVSTTLIGDALREIASSFRARVEAALEPEGLTFQQATVLYLIGHRAGIALTELAELSATSVPNTSGIGLEDRVAVIVPRSIERIVALAGVLGAGATYVPLEASEPPDRLAGLLARARADAPGWITVARCVSSKSSRCAAVPVANAAQ